MLNYQICKNWRFQDRVCSYASKDVILYALGLGVGGNPTDPAQLKLIYEKELVVLPTFATVLGAAGMWMADPATGIDVSRLVHGEQHLKLLRPLAPGGQVLVRHVVESVVDKGAGRGALLVVRKELREPADESLLAVARSVIVLRGDGGFSACSPTDPEPERLPAMPSGPAGRDIAYETLPQAALIYRLSGDLNPLHVDPAAALRAGFPRPILHGLCTFGMAARAAVEVLAGGDPARLSGISARFTAPVWPGETVRFEFWLEGRTRARLRARVDDRQSVVLDQGVVELDGAT